LFERRYSLALSFEAYYPSIEFDDSVIVRDVQITNQPSGVKIAVTVSTNIASAEYSKLLVLTSKPKGAIVWRIVSVCPHQKSSLN
jgi:hypothetical protein